MQAISPRLLATFLSELEERLSGFERDLLALEESRDPAERAELVTSLFRAAHSLKGAAGAVGLDEIALVSHRLEDSLSVWRDRPPAAGEISVDQLFAAVDKLRRCGRAIPGGVAVDSPAQPPSKTSAVSTNGQDESGALRDADATLRVSADKLDALLQQTGELVIAHHRIELRHGEIVTLGEVVRSLRDRRLRDLERALDRLATSVSADRAFLERSARRVDAEVRDMRMLPFSVACQGIERIVRDASHDLKKSCGVQILGGTIEIDRAILEGVRDPLVHLVRNAVVHGIETPEERTRRGKPREGSVVVKAELRGGGVEITVSDDGAGLDLETLRKRAQERGFSLGDAELGNAVFLPGVSTASTITNLSGRGVGLDAVRSKIESLRGTVSVQSLPGSGTTFTLTMPLTLTTLRAILFQVDSKTYAIESSAVERVLRPAEGEIVSIEGRRRILRDGAAMSLVDCGELFGRARTDETKPELARPVLLIRDLAGRVALAVDAVIEEREVVVRPLGPRLKGARSSIGATILADGAVAVIVRAGYVVQHALSLARTPATAAKAASQSEIRKHILLVEDSITTRTLERSILEAQGFDVTTAADGEEAWRALQTADVDLVVSDVDMPLLDGFGLTERIRRSERLRDLPIVLVTSRSSDADKRKGLELGADAYVKKAGFDQTELLHTIRELM